jgi:hypothetical protein
MIFSSSSKIGAIFIFLIILAVKLEAQNNSMYVNARYGFQVSYPAFLISAPNPANGDGIRMYDKKGFVLVASGINNESGETFQSELNTQWESIGKITYGVRGDNWFAISGFKGDKIIYIKSYIGTGSINHLYIEYPKDQRDRYDKIVETIEKSFKPGDLTKNH